MFGYIALNSTKYRANGLVVALLVVRDKVFPVPVLLIGYDFGKFINLKLLVLWRMGIIESPLLKRNISTDKVLLFKGMHPDPYLFLKNELCYMDTHIR